MRIALAALYLFALNAGQVKAEMTVKRYRVGMRSKDANVVATAKMYVKGLGDGMSWVNAAADKYTKAPIFCPPPNLGLGLENYVDIIDRQIKELSTRSTQAQIDETP
jgi:hypothetical protein